MAIEFVGVWIGAGVGSSQTEFVMQCNIHKQTKQTNSLKLVHAQTETNKIKLRVTFGILVVLVEYEVQLGTCVGALIIIMNAVSSISNQTLVFCHQLFHYHQLD